MSRYLKITWKNSVDLGDVLYATGYENRIFLDVEVERPEYRVTVESELDGDNHEKTTFRKWEKARRFEVWGTEDLVDAFTFMQTHDTITVTLQTGETIAVDQMRVDYDWQECLCKMTVTFAEDYAIGTNCDENMSTGCVCDETEEFGGFLDEAVKGSTSGMKGDIVFFYDPVSSDVPKAYVGSFWELQTTGLYDWVELDSTIGDCWEDTTLGIGTWRISSTNLVLVRFPGAIATLLNVSGDTTRITLYGLIENTFVEVLYSGDATGSGGIFNSSDFLAGIVTFELPGSGNYDIECHIYNHSCDYGNTEKEPFSY